MKIHKLFFVLAIFVMAPLTAQASLISFELTWLGQGNLIATGRVTFDDEILPNPQPVFNNFVSAATLGITDFMITVTGTALETGNGTFGLDDFSGFAFQTGNAPLDLSKELIAQGLLDFNVSTSCCGGASNPIAPDAYSPLTLSSGALNEKFLLVSMTPISVPVPASVWLFVSGLIGLISFTRHKKV